MKRLLTLTLGLVLLGAPARADDKEKPKEPATPGWTHDEKVLGKKTPTEFFDARIKDTANRKKRDDAKKAFDDKLTAINDMIGKDDEDKIDKAERELEKLRAARLVLEEQYGDCVTQEIRSENFGPKKTWFVTDGTCRMNVKDDAEAKAAFDRLVDGFTHTKKYVRDDDKKTRAFKQILYLSVVDPKSGEKLEKRDEFGKSPEHLFMIVEALNLGVLIRAVAYYLENTWEVVNTDAGREFHLTYKTLPRPRGLTNPAFTYTARSGKTTRVVQENLEEVKGYWFVREKDRMLRYWTGANFKLDLGEEKETDNPIVKAIFKIGRPVLLDSLVSADERGAEGKF